MNNKLIIKEPIWHSQSIGINKQLIKDELEIEISYKYANGARMFPETYVITKNEISKYPIQKLSSGVSLYIIPIKDLKIKMQIILSLEEQAKKDYYDTLGINEQR